MKKINAFGTFNIIGIIIGFAGVIRLLTKPETEAFAALNLPSGFPTRSGFIVIWGILSLLWVAACLFVYSVSLSPRRMRNIFLNSLILIIGIFVWHFMVFSAGNAAGAMALSIAMLLLAVVVWFMYLVIHRYGGYLFTPLVVWHLYQLYLGISLAVKN